MTTARRTPSKGRDVGGCIEVGETWCDATVSPWTPFVSLDEYLFKYVFY
jgi:hypothetical protein